MKFYQYFAGQKLPGNIKIKPYDPFFHHCNGGVIFVQHLFTSP